METEFPYLKIETPEQKKLVGKPDKGTRIYRREGTYMESGVWCVAIDEAFDEQFVSPGGVCMFVPASRAAVHKRMIEGRLTAFCFHVVHPEKTLFGKERKAKATPFVFIPVSECKAWAKELQEKRVRREVADLVHERMDFLLRDPEDAGNKKVLYTDKYAFKDFEGWLKTEREEMAKERVKREKGED